MMLRIPNAICTLTRRLKTEHVRSMFAMVTFNHSLSYGSASFLPRVLSSTHKTQLASIFQAQKMSLSTDTTSQAAIKEIKFEDLKEQLNNDLIILIDVRELKELKTDGTIPKSIHIPLGEIKGAFSLSPEKFHQKYGIPQPSQHGINLVLSCRSGRRATMAIEELHKLGYENTICYCGSFLDWEAKGGQIEKL